MPPTALAIMQQRSQSKHSNPTAHSAVPSSPRMADSWTSTSWKDSSTVGEVRLPSFLSSLETVNPGVSVSTRKAVKALPAGASGSVRATTVTTSASEPLVMKVLVPLRTKVSPSRRRGLHPGGVGAGLGLGDRERADDSPLASLRQPALLLLLGAVQRDRHAADGQVRAEREVQPRVAAAVGERLERQPGGEHVGAGPAVLLGDRQPGEPELGALLPDLGSHAPARSRSRMPGSTCSRAKARTLS
jgi:hypothetical protein